MKISCFVVTGLLLLMAPSPASAQKAAVPSAATTGADAGITHEQADQILNELRRIRQLLETDPQTAAQTDPLAPRNISLATVGDWPALGKDTAPVTVVEFLDYQCPFCRKFHSDTFARFKKEYVDTGKVRFVVRDMPLSFHQNAAGAAEAAHCAADQQHFWEMYDLLLSSDIAPDSLPGLAEKAGLNKESFQKCLADDTHKAQIQKEAVSAASLGVMATPTFIVAPTSTTKVTGEELMGAPPLSALEAAIGKLQGSQTGTASAAGAAGGTAPKSK